MTTTITDYVRVEARAAELGCVYPTGMAILPENFDTAADYIDLRQQSEAGTVRTLFRTNGLSLVEVLPELKPVPYIQNNSSEWVGPTLFISYAFFSENPLVVSVALGILANYLTEFFKGLPGKNKITLNIVVEKTPERSCKKISYEGNAEGLESLPEIIRSIADE
jgi:hypothetical protein